MNRLGIVKSGLVAGVVLLAVNVLAQYALMGRAQREMDAWVPGLSSRLDTGAAALVAGVLMKLTIGWILVWIYASIRPRFGPGLRTASYAAGVVWLLGGIFFSDLPMMGMMSLATYGLLEVFQLGGLLLAAWAGARLYSERDPPLSPRP